MSLKSREDVLQQITAGVAVVDLDSYMLDSDAAHSAPAASSDLEIKQEPGDEDASAPRTDVPVPNAAAHVGLGPSIFHRSGSRASSEADNGVPTNNQEEDNEIPMSNQGEDSEIPMRSQSQLFERQKHMSASLRAWKAARGPHSVPASHDHISEEESDQEQTTTTGSRSLAELEAACARAEHDRDLCLRQGRSVLMKEIDFIVAKRNLDKERARLAREECMGNGDGDDDGDDDDETGLFVKHDASSEQVRRRAGRMGRSRRRIEQPGQVNSHTFNNTNNVFDDQVAGENLDPVQPSYGAAPVRKNRHVALRALLESLPLEKKRYARADMRYLNECMKDFTGRGSVKPVQGSRGWLIYGMKTALTNPQIVSTAFMRRREDGNHECKGGILADSMGMGKTLCAIANMVNGRPRIESDSENYTTLVVVPASIVTQWSEEILRHTNNVRRGRGWGIRGTLVFRASDESARTSTTQDLLDKDVVITTYKDITASFVELPEGLEDGPALDDAMQEVERQQGLLHKTPFRRVILDEAHTIRNPETKGFKACRALIGEHRWCLTGTPLVNGVMDLYALFDFIHHPSAGSYATFKRKYVDKNDPMSLGRLSADLGACMTRFTHRNEFLGARLVDLPKATGTTERLTFTRLEMAIYNIVVNRFRSTVQKLNEEGALKSVQIWTLVLRLRQITAHPLMISQSDVCTFLENEDFDKLEALCQGEGRSQNDGANVILTLRNHLARAKETVGHVAADHEEGADEQHQSRAPLHVVRDHAESALRGTGGAHGKSMLFKPYLAAIKRTDFYQMNHAFVCSVCDQEPHEPYISKCSHVYCEDCLTRHMAESAESDEDRAECAECGEILITHPINAYDEPEPKRSGRKPMWMDLTDDLIPSTKTIATKAAILNFWDVQAGGDPSNKIIVFSQWLPMIRILSRMCEVEGWGHTTLIGAHSRKKRDANLEKFKTIPDTKILISSLRTGGQGLNLAAASKVIMIDPWWNDALEQQAFCRVFRIGQQKETTLLNLCISGTVDDKLAQLKVKKTAEINKVMLNYKEGRKAKLKEALGVLGLVEEDATGRLIVEELEGSSSSEEESDEEEEDEQGS